MWKMLERHSGVPNDGSCKMQKGSIDISPGWVTRGQHNRQPIAPLVNFRDDNNVLKFIPAMSEPAETLNWILTLTHVNQYRIACDTCDVLPVVLNGTTAPHLDLSGTDEGYDLLAIAGTANGAILELPDLDISLRYPPGTATLLCGLIFQHAVPFLASILYQTVVYPCLKQDFNVFLKHDNLMTF
ncbi:hypothetical protein V8E52_003871 [Russula decolorans]